MYFQEEVYGPHYSPVMFYSSRNYHIWKQIEKKVSCNNAFSTDYSQYIYNPAKKKKLEIKINLLTYSWQILFTVIQLEWKVSVSNRDYSTFQNWHSLKSCRNEYGMRYNIKKYGAIYQSHDLIRKLEVTSRCKYKELLS